MSESIADKIFEDRKRTAQRDLGVKIYDEPPTKIKPCLFHQTAKSVGSFKYCGKCGRVEIYVGPESGWHTVGWTDISTSNKGDEKP